MTNDQFSIHVPVLQKEVIEYLDPKSNENFIDCTIDGGGHALSILEKTKPNGKLLGIDWDQELIKNLESRIQNLEFDKRLIPVCDSFVNLREIVKKEKFESISGILFDLGLSSWHLEESKRGFSFLKDEPLIMRYDGDTTKLTAEKIVNDWPEIEIERILRDYGEEKFAKSISKKIIQNRPIKSTLKLVAVIKKAIPGRYLNYRINFATRTFQALRIAVNEELNNLEKALPQASEILETNGRLAVISFHSLEDRIVKNFFKTTSCLKILTKKPIRSSEEEIKINPRSRSAKLRAAIKI